MKNYIRPAALLGVLCLLLAGCGRENTTPLSGEAEMTPAAEPTQAPSGLLEGTVYDGTMSTLVVEAADGCRYAFPKEPDLVTAPDGILAGYRACVRYRGVLDAATLFQDVEVSEIRIEAVETPCPAAALPAEEQEETQEDAAERAAREERAEELMAEMSLEEKVGQMFLVRCPRQNAAALAERYHLGGYVLYGENTVGQSSESLRTSLAELQESVSLPLLIAVDEEGGPVNRLSTSTAFRTEPYPAPMELYRSGGWEAVDEDTASKCVLLRHLGIQVNLAPVCDVCADPSAFMYGRSFGADAELTGQYVSRVVAGYARGGVGCVLKHFPGYGDNADTHTGAVRDSRSLAELEARDMLPFRAGIDAGAGCVLVSHNVVECLDAERPASLSPEVHRYLREELGFTGVIMTDDLYMSAIRQFATDEAAAVMAVQAGNDLLCCTEFAAPIQAVVAAVENGEIARETVDAAVKRILCWKLELGVLR